MFALRYLKGRGYSTREIYRFPREGSGSGEQFVRDHFAKEVGVQRKGGSYQTLVALTDADILTAQARRETLLNQLKKGEERKPDERIAILIPKRNIETWIMALNGADESPGAEASAREDRGRAAF